MIIQRNGNLALVLLLLAAQPDKAATIRLIRSEYVVEQIQMSFGSCRKQIRAAGGEGRDRGGGGRAERSAQIGRRAGERV